MYVLLTWYHENKYNTVKYRCTYLTSFIYYILRLHLCVRRSAICARQYHNMSYSTYLYLMFITFLGRNIIMIIRFFVFVLVSVRSGFFLRNLDALLKGHQCTTQHILVLVYLHALVNENQRRTSIGGHRGTNHYRSCSCFLVATIPLCCWRTAGCWPNLRWRAMLTSPKLVWFSLISALRFFSWTVGIL